MIDRDMAGPLKMCTPTKDGDCDGVNTARILFAAATLDGTLQLAELKRPPYWELKVRGLIPPCFYSPLFVYFYYLSP